MKRIFCILFFLVGFVSMEAQTIRFDHVGEQDKPMPEFQINQGLLPAYSLSTRLEHIITVDEKTFRELSAYIRDWKPQHYAFDNASNNFGTYQIVIHYDRTNALQYFLKREDAKVFFNKMLPLIKTDSKFYKAIESVIKRLG